MTVSAVFFRAGTVGNVQGPGVNGDPEPLTRRAYRQDSPPSPPVLPAPPFLTYRQEEDARRPSVRPARGGGGTGAPPAGERAPGGDTGSMKLSRPVSWFLLAFGVWSWVIWVTFAKNLWKDGSGLAFDDAGDPTAYFWVHLLLAITSFLLGTAVGFIGFRGLKALRTERA